MEINLNAVGRKFTSKSLFKNFNFCFNIINNPYCIIGPNGSGKSTLLSLLSGYENPSDGVISLKINTTNVHRDNWYKYISLVAPYLELIEEFTLSEMLSFHFKFNKYNDDFDHNLVLKVIGLEKSKDKELKHFSSGMKQRVKLALAFFSNKPILLLDEPTINLDAEGIDWYRSIMEEQIKTKLTIIASNSMYEYEFAKNLINITHYQ